MTDVLLVVLVLLILGLAGWYVIRAKRQGRRCIGCPEKGCDGCCCHQDSRS
ncbi:MAG: FeoB-associated Cys-rich membrane protein [Ruminococcaceae bacterium]|nr:FeoB-associated Cys-rich membrane protein [Oscillospiraceae bacterium]